MKKLINLFILNMLNPFLNSFNLYSGLYLLSYSYLTLRLLFEHFVLLKFLG